MSMDFLEMKEASGIKQDMKNGAIKQTADNAIFEKRLLNGLGKEIEETLEHPEKMEENIAFAKKANKKKRRAIWKENLKRIFS